jgi:D-3-phosphoglycerate dehydrogenase
LTTEPTRTLLLRIEGRHGIVGLVGSELGAAGVNIVNFSLGATGEGQARAAITVDRRVQNAELDALRGKHGILSIEML